MKTWLRAILALISAGFSYFIYIYLAGKYLLQIQDVIPSLSGVTIDLGDFPSLVVYIQAIGYMIVATNFSFKFAPDGSKIRAIWRLVKSLLKIIFWSIFIYVGFNTIDVGASYGSFTLNIGVNIILLFYAMMGGVIFEMILSILDFFIAFFPPKDPDAKAKKKAAAAAGGD